MKPKVREILGMGANRGTHIFVLTIAQTIYINVSNVQGAADFLAQIPAITCSPNFKRALTLI